MGIKGDYWMLPEVKLTLQNHMCLAHKDLVTPDAYKDTQICARWVSSLFLLLLFPAVPVLQRGCSCIRQHYHMKKSGSLGWICVWMSVRFCQGWTQLPTLIFSSLSLIPLSQGNLSQWQSLKWESPASLHQVLSATLRSSYGGTWAHPSACHSQHGRTSSHPQHYLPVFLTPSCCSSPVTSVVPQGPSTIWHKASIEKKQMLLARQCALTSPRYSRRRGQPQALRPASSQHKQTELFCKDWAEAGFQQVQSPLRIAQCDD